MTKISEYSVISNPEVDDLLIGTDKNNSDITKNFEVSSLIALALKAPVLSDVYEFEDNQDAIDGGLVVGSIYRTGDLLKIVHE